MSPKTKAAKAEKTDVEVPEHQLAPDGPYPQPDAPGVVHQDEAEKLAEQDAPWPQPAEGISQDEAQKLAEKADPDDVDQSAQMEASELFGH